MWLVSQCGGGRVLYIDDDNINRQTETIEFRNETNRKIQPRFFFIFHFTG